MTKYQIYRKLLKNIKDASKDGLKSFGTQLALTKDMTARLTKRGYAVFEMSSNKGSTFIISGIMRVKTLEEGFPALKLIQGGEGSGNESEAKEGPAQSFLEAVDGTPARNKDGV